MSQQNQTTDESSIDDDQELGITESKKHNTGEWYAEVVRKAKLASYAPMGGFIITRPRGYALWEQVQNHLDAWFKKTGVQNAYFPMFIPESYLEQEAEIVEGFDPEVAWVTQGGYDELDERLAVRPTSESIIAPFMAEWTRSHRDLPLRLNQWCSVCRWEATDTKPFFRTKEFLWQEGHTAHATEQNAWNEAMTRLDQYERLYEEIFAIPVLKGRKPEHDKFPGADTTTTVEVLMPDGKSVQGATSHYLGQSFAEAFDITFTDQDEVERTAHTASWGLSWRALGALIMTHSDDQGLVLPPAMAPEQVVVVPIWDGDSKIGVTSYAEEVADRLSAAGLRVEYDDRETYSPGFKFNEHELQGVPVRVEVGPNELAERSLTLVERPDGATRSINATDAVAGVEAALDSVYETLYERAGATLESNIREADSYEAILGTIGEHGGYVRAPWCGDEACEDAVKDEVHAEIVMIPFEDGEDVDSGAACAVCGENAREVAYFARSH
jgi:prolyl-tRNA synthetase